MLLGHMSTNTDNNTYLGESLHHVGHRAGKVTIPDSQFGVATPKQKVVHHIQSGICRSDQEDEIVQTFLLDTA